MASDASIPWTSTPAAASGSATLPVPIPSSSAGPTPASEERNSTVVATSPVCGASA